MDRNMAKWSVDTKSDGADCTIEGDDLVDADDALTLVAEHARETDSAEHPEGRAAWARERGWTAERVA